MEPSDARRRRNGSRHRLRPLEVLVADGRGRTISASRLARWLVDVAPAGARGTVSVAVVSDAQVRALNRRYRRIDRATDVLSFPAESQRRREPVIPHPSSRAVRPFLGDIVIARGTARRQARAMGHPESTELRVLALHGLLHLLGYDHDRDGGRMRRTEQRLRRAGGLREGLIERSAIGRHRDR